MVTEDLKEYCLRCQPMYLEGDQSGAYLCPKHDSSGRDRLVRALQAICASDPEKQSNYLLSRRECADVAADALGIPSAERPWIAL